MALQLGLVIIHTPLNDGAADDETPKVCLAPNEEDELSFNITSITVGLPGKTTLIPNEK